MQADITRDTFLHAKAMQFIRVFQQQGRVFDDADFNEMNAILLHYLQSFAADIVGPHGGPVSNLGYEVADVDNLSSNDQQKLTDAGVLPIDEKDFLLGVGHYYVGGMLCENNMPIAYSRQLGYPFPDTEEVESNKAYLVFLDTWERYVSAAEDEFIREVALGGPDTTGRAKIMAQVKIPSLDSDSQTLLQELWENLKNSDNEENTTNAAKQAVEDFAEEQRKKILQLSNAFLRARAWVEQTSDDPCTIPPQAQYRGAENQLYRVEIHKSGTAKSGDNEDFATFKWSRENGSVILPIRDLHGAIAIVLHLGSDTRLGLQVNDWVEVVDDELVARGEPGELIQVAEIDPVEMKVTLKNPSSRSYDKNSLIHPLFRRWDQREKESELVDGAIAITEGDGEGSDQWINLEDGVQIQFSKPTGDTKTYYRAGDYWLIPSRIATRDVEWEKQLEPNGTVSKYPSNNPIPAAQPPRGVIHQYAPLAVVTLNGNPMKVTLVQDCRRSFKQLWKI